MVSLCYHTTIEADHTLSSEEVGQRTDFDHAAPFDKSRRIQQRSKLVQGKPNGK